MAQDLTALLALDSAEIDSHILALGVEGRRALLAGAAPQQLSSVLGKLATHTWTELGRQGIAALGTYRVQLTKRERIKGELGAPQTLDLHVRPAPLAFRIDFLRGPSAGRRALYNAELRKDEIRVKEAGMLGLAGAVWLHLDNPLTRRDTNHRSTEIGLSALLDLIERDIELAKPFGGHTRRDEGLDARGFFTSVFTAPETSHGLYAKSTRVGFDPAASLPMRIEVHDDAGFLESYEYKALESVAPPADFFSVKGAKL